MTDCCITCQYFYTEYGMDLCKREEEPMENIYEEKCSEYVMHCDLQEERRKKHGTK